MRRFKNTFMKKQMLFGLAFTTLCMQAGAQTMLDSVVIRENRIQLPFSKQNRDIRVLDKNRSLHYLLSLSTNSFLMWQE